MKEQSGTFAAAHASAHASRKSTIPCPPRWKTKRERATPALAGWGVLGPCRVRMIGNATFVQGTSAGFGDHRRLMLADGSELTIVRVRTRRTE
jgi:ferric-dicitrate binding protein FerR (iron transport regulator)